MPVLTRLVLLVALLILVVGCLWSLLGGTCAPTSSQEHIGVQAASIAAPSAELVNQGVTEAGELDSVGRVPVSESICDVFVQDESGSPVPGAQLGSYVDSHSGAVAVDWMTVSDDRGRGVMRADLSDDTRFLVAAKAPFLSDTVKWTPGQRRAVFVLRRKGGARITVTDWHGQRIPEVTVIASAQWPHLDADLPNLAWPAGLLPPGAPATVRVAKTGLTGIATLENLASGMHVFHARLDGYAVGGDVAADCFRHVVSGEYVDVHLKMLPMYCAVVDIGHQAVAKSAWSVTGQVAIPGLATVDIVAARSKLVSQLPGKLVTVFILPFGELDRAEHVVQLGVMTMDGKWHSFDVPAHPVTRFSSFDIEEVRVPVCAVVGGVVTFEGAEAYQRLGIVLRHQETGQDWSVGSSSSLALPAGHYQMVAADDVVMAALAPSDSLSFSLSEGGHVSCVLRCAADYGRCRFSMRDEAGRVIRNYVVRIREVGAQDWVTWSGAFSKHRDIVAMLRSGSEHELEVEANGFEMSRIVWLPKLGQGEESFADMMIVMKQKRDGL